MDKLKYFLSLFLICLISISFISCVHAESNINESNNDELMVTDINNNKTINDNITIINNETNNNEIIIPSIINNTENITVVDSKKHININDNLNNYNHNNNGNGSNILIDNNSRNDLIKWKLNNTDNNNEDLIYMHHGMVYNFIYFWFMILS